MHSMKEILTNCDLFATRFLAEETKNRLKNIPVNNLMLVIKSLDLLWEFKAYSTPRTWTPKDDEPLIVIGKLTKNASVKQPRFGLCTTPSIDHQGLEGSLHIWTDRKTLNEYLVSSDTPVSFQNEWVDWRVKSKKDRFVRYKLALIDEYGNSTNELELKNSHINKFISSLAERINVTSELIDLIKPILDSQQLASDAMTPFALDAFKHSDDEDFDRNEDEPEEPELNEKLPAMTPLSGFNSQKIHVVKHFDCSHLFTVDTSSSRHPQIGFLNFNIKAKQNINEELIGPGIYGLFYKKQLIYTGLFKNGNKGTPYGGNIADMRWKKHLATVTMRGKDVSVAISTLRYIYNTERNDSLVKICDPNAQELMIKGRGCVAGLRRVLFALENWNDFKIMTPETLLDPFSFTYIRLAPALKDFEEVRNRIVKTEKVVIKEFMSVCNKETPIGKAKRNVERDEFISFVTSTLDQI
jgi:hypothetical protein